MSLRNLTPCTSGCRSSCVSGLCVSAQVAGTEQGVTEPEATFSACFGGAFLMWHPMKVRIPDDDHPVVARVANQHRIRLFPFLRHVLLDPVGLAYPDGNTVQ